MYARDTWVHAAGCGSSAGGPVLGSHVQWDERLHELNLAVVHARPSANGCRWRSQRVPMAPHSRFAWRNPYRRVRRGLRMRYHRRRQLNELDRGELPILARVSFRSISPTLHPAL